MQSTLPKSPILWFGAVATFAMASTLSSRPGGVESGVNSVPLNCSSQLPACSSCHSGSAPFTGRTGAPTATLTMAKSALNLNETMSITSSVTGGVSGTTGGFICQTTAGAFSGGSNSHVMVSSASITHANENSRSWTFTYTAPNTVGPVQLTNCAMTSNGSNSSGDRFSFTGSNNNATTATPVRLFVLPAGVTNKGVSCPDGYGNRSVLGANSAPTVGNLGFSLELIGATPGTIAILFAGFNPPGFFSVDLGPLLGLTGCNAYLANIAATLTAVTSAGSAERAEGAASFPLPLPNNPGLHGAVIDVQGGYIDPSVAAMRAMALSFSNGLMISIL